MQTKIVTCKKYADKTNKQYEIISNGKRNDLIMDGKYLYSCETINNEHLYEYDK